MPSLQDFQAYAQALQRHDWNYDFSDDHSVWLSGRAHERQLRAQAGSDALYMQAFTTWTDFMTTTQNAQERDKRDRRIALIVIALTAAERAAV